jgi:hypothetical protein
MIQLSSGPEDPLFFFSVRPGPENAFEDVRIWLE